ncbi:MAG: biotin--[acetyl-CoA-carboxylase] ligase [Bacteroidota bacterium]
MNINSPEKKIFYFPSLNSTNKKAKELLQSETLPEGSVIFTSDQQQGKGYGNNIWESEPEKNLTASFILKPTFIKPYKQFLLTQLISLATMNVVKHFYKGEKRISIKWPNDIYAGDYKIAGILTENIIMGDKIQTTIAGIGININQVKFSDKLPNPTSLFLLTKQKTKPEVALDLLYQQIFHYYTLLQNSNNSTLELNYLENLYRYNLKSRYKTNELGTFDGIITGIDVLGRLKIKTNDNKTSLFSFKEIEFII